jgi:hypothetical protein
MAWGKPGILANKRFDLGVQRPRPPDDAALWYESPFTDLTPKGPDGLFTSKQVDELVAVLERVRGTAVAA